MRKIDLGRAHGAVDLSGDVCVVGAGAAGSYIANRLVRGGLSVVLLEAGGTQTIDGTEAIDLLPAFELDEYAGARMGRAFGLGGTTSRWGGQLLPYSSLELRGESEPIEAAWRHVVAIVEKNGETVRGVLGISDSGQMFRHLGNLKAHGTTLTSEGIAIVASTWLPFRRRNLQVLLDEVDDEGGLTVLTNATASAWEGIATRTDGSAHVERVEVRGPASAFARVKARAFVVAAGAIETTRILLEIRDALGTRDLPGLGCHLSDHLSCRVANVSPPHRGHVAGAFGPRFQGAEMITYRFVEPQILRVQGTGFFHFVFERNDEAFSAARTILQDLQRGRRMRISWKQAVAAGPGALALAFNRYARSRLFIPNGTPAHLRLDLEQQALRDNSIRLSDELDGMRRRKAILRWRIRDKDLDNIHEASRRFLRKWQRAFPGTLELKECLDNIQSNGNLNDSYHPVGTCRLGTDADSVVGPDLRMHGLNNLFVLSTAIFPTAGAANPSFSLLCFGEELSRCLTNAAGR